MAGKGRVDQQIFASWSTQVFNEARSARRSEGSLKLQVQLAAIELVTGAEYDGTISHRPSAQPVYLRLRIGFRGAFDDLECGLINEDAFIVADIANGRWCGAG